MRASQTRSALRSGRMQGTVKRTWNLPLDLAEALEREAKRRRTTVTTVLHGILGRALATKDPLEETRRRVAIYSSIPSICPTWNCCVW